MKILNIKLDYKDPFKVPLKSAKPFVLKSLDLAHKLALKPLSSLLETKRLMKQGQAELVKKQMAEEGAIFTRMLKEPAALEVFDAFMEKRRPDFSKI